MYGTTERGRVRISKPKKECVMPLFCFGGSRFISSLENQHPIYTKLTVKADNTPKYNILLKPSDSSISGSQEAHWAPAPRSTLSTQIGR